LTSVLAPLAAIIFTRKACHKTSRLTVIRVTHPDDIYDPI
jgi:hypothetical protein